MAKIVVRIEAEIEVGDTPVAEITAIAELFLTNAQHYVAPQLRVTDVQVVRVELDNTSPYGRRNSDALAERDIEALVYWRDHRHVWAHMSSGFGFSAS